MTKEKKPLTRVVPTRKTASVQKWIPFTSDEISVMLEGGAVKPEPHPDPLGFRNWRLNQDGIMLK